MFQPLRMMMREPESRVLVAAAGMTIAVGSVGYMLIGVGIIAAFVTELARHRPIRGLGTAVARAEGSISLGSERDSGNGSADPGDAT